MRARLIGTAVSLLPPLRKDRALSMRSKDIKRHSSLLFFPPSAFSSPCETAPVPRIVSRKVRFYRFENPSSVTLSKRFCPWVR